MTQKSDEHPISPHSITAESNIKVMRTKELITIQDSSWLLNKYFLKIKIYENSHICTAVERWN